MLRNATLAVAAAAIAAGVLVSAAVAQEKDDVRLRLNWMYYGSHAPFALGKDRGYYSDEGINLDIRSGNGSSATARLVANGDSDFAYGACAAMVTLATQGAPLISVGVIDAMGTEAIMVRPDSGITKIEDLKGKTLLTTANAGVNTFISLVFKNAGLSDGDVSLINVPEGALISGYIQGPGGSVGILGGLDNGPSEIKAAGGPAPVAFPYSDYGVHQVGYCVVTNTETVKNRSDLVKRFMAATVKSYAEAEKDPDAAVAAMADIVGGTMAEDVGKAQAREVLDVTLGILYSAANKDKRLGYNVPEDWDSMLALMKEYNDLQTDQPASAFYTNDFVP
jgi:NitT/TauT family transport system substrate-binding protein